MYMNTMLPKGIYIITFKDRCGVFYKLGFSMNFHARFYNYDAAVIPPQKEGMKVFYLDGDEEDY